MSTNTPNFNLKKPDPEDFYNIADQNENMDKIDTALKNIDEKASNIDLSGVATKEELNDHKNENASLTNKGHVQLSNAIDSDRETEAATPKAVKEVAEMATTASDEAKQYVKDQIAMDKYYILSQILP